MKILAVILIALALLQLLGFGVSTLLVVAAILTGILILLGW